MTIAILFTRSKLRPAANDAVAGKLVTSKAHERWKMLESAKPLVLTWYGYFDIFCIPLRVSPADFRPQGPKTIPFCYHFVKKVNVG